MAFKDIRGQDSAIMALKRFMLNQRLAPAYLFSGPEGVGKRMVAKTLAKAINCLTTNLDSCDLCASCLKIEKGEHPDVHIVDSDGGEIKIESIRQLQNEINVRPYEGRKKVFIIDEAHNLNPESSNAFLKMLEESPGENLIILLSSKPKIIFKTVLSRCQTLKFFPLRRSELEKILKEEYALNQDLAHYLAYVTEGSLGKSLRLKDSDVLSQKNRIIDDFILNPRQNIELISKQSKNSIGSDLNVLATWFRDIYLLKIGVPFPELIHFDRKDELLKKMNRYSFLDLEEILNSVSNALVYLDSNVNVKLLISNLRTEIWRN